MLGQINLYDAIFFKHVFFFETTFRAAREGFEQLISKIFNFIFVFNQNLSHLFERSLIFGTKIKKSEADSK